MFSALFVKIQDVRVGKKGRGSFRASEYLDWPVFPVFLLFLSTNQLTALIQYPLRKGGGWFMWIYLMIWEQILPHGYMWDILVFTTCSTVPYTGSIFKKVLIEFKYGNVFPFPEIVARLFGSTIQDYKDRQDYVAFVDVPNSYNGPRLQFPLTFTDIDLLVDAFKQQQASGSRYLPDSCT